MTDDDPTDIIAEFGRISRAYTALAWVTLPLCGVLAAQVFLRDEKLLPFAGLLLLQFAEWRVGRLLKGRARAAEARFFRWAAEHGYVVKPRGDA